MKNIIIRESRRKAWKVTGAGIFMLAASALLFIMGIQDKDTLFQIVGISGILFFGVNAVYQLIRLAKKRILLVIKEDSIDVCDSASAPGVIPFYEIDDFKVISNGRGHRLIGVMLKKPEEMLKRLSGSRKRAVESNLKNKYPPVLIWVDTAQEYKLDDIIKILKERLDLYQRGRESEG